MLEISETVWKKQISSLLKKCYVQNVFRNYIFNIYVFKGFGIK